MFKTLYFEEKETFNITEFPFTHLCAIQLQWLGLEVLYVAIFLLSQSLGESIQPFTIKNYVNLKLFIDTFYLVEEFPIFK